MQYTSNLNLKKPEGTDVVNVQDLNDNVDIIDLEITKKATDTQDGRMSKKDKQKIDGIQEYANKYVHPSTHSLDMITETTTKKIMTNAERTKLEGIEENANNYIHPSTHSLDMITETTTKKIMTDAERTKLEGIRNNANNYIHPSKHPASMITQDSTHRFVTDSEKLAWNAKETPNGAQAKVNAHTSKKNNPHNVTAAQIGASNILKEVKTVDGSGSGLDADTVDGCHVDTDYNGTQYQIARYNANRRVYDSERLQGAVPSTAHTANTIGKRDGAGDLHCRLLRQTYTSPTSSPNYILVQHAVGSGKDNYARPCSLASLKTSLGSMPANGGNSNTVDGKHAAGTLLTNEKSNLVASINELFTNVSNGKSVIASAITGKGVNASGSDSFATLGNKIKSISTGVKYASGTTTSSTISRTLGWEAKLIVVRGTRGFWVFSKNKWSTRYASGYSTATSSYNMIYTYPNYNSCRHANWTGTWTTSGFSLTVPHTTGSGTLTWYAYGLAP